MAASRRSPLRPSIRLSPAHSRENSRSASPERHPGSLYQKIDPLLSNLSPESTLSALTSTEAVPSNEAFSHDVLSQSISQVSPAERALGIRAAIAAQHLNIWYKEVQSWTWPNQSDAKAGKGFVPPVGFDLRERENAGESSPLLPAPVSDMEFYGSLPANVVESYEKRVEEIRDGMDNLNVEELKEHVLNAHIPSRSRPSSATSTVSVPPPLTYVQLSDFTAVVTATILRALPYLSRLGNLLSTWDVRLLVLRQIPGLLRELKTIRYSLDSSLHALRSCESSTSSLTPFAESYLRDEHVQLELAVVTVGRRMDRVLDALEGCADSLPEDWIDDLEKIESDFAGWVVEAERYKLRMEWLRTKDEPKATEMHKVTEPQCDDSPEEAKQDATSAVDASKSQVQERPPMETIEEEPRPGSHASMPKEAPRLEESEDLESSGRVDSGVVAATEPEAYQEAGTSVDTDQYSEPRANIIVAEDVQTPTQPIYSHRSIETPDQSPARVPLPATPDVDNKENIPPPGFIPAHIPLSSPREQTPKPGPLTERDMGDDPFIQKPASTSTVRVEPNVISVPGPLPDAPQTENDNSAGRKLDKTAAHAHEEPKQAPNRAAPSHLTEPLFEPPTAAVAREIVHDDSMKPQPEAQPSDTTNPDLPAPSQLQITNDARHAGCETSENIQSQQALDVQVVSIDASAAQDTSRPETDVPVSQGSSRKPLQSPIKLAKIRSGKSTPNKEQHKPRSRRPSMASAGSLDSNNSSFISASEDVEPITVSPSDARPSKPRRSEPRQPGPIVFNNDHLLREDRLRRLENTKSSSLTTFQPSRSVSLPLERFIMDLNLEDDTAPRVPDFAPSSQGSATAELPNNPRTTAVPPPLPRRPGLTRGKSASDLKSSDQVARNMAYNAKAFGRNTALRAMQHQDQPKSARLRKRLTTHPSLESLGMKRQELAYVEEDESEFADIASRASSPNKQPRKPRDQLDEKISSILNTLPGRIHLVDPNNEADTSSSSSSLDRKTHERYLSESPHGPSRSMTPAPSLTLMPASRKRSSHAHKMEDSYVKLYHLHHGGQSAPTKLFVRTVGEDGKRVMVRVGGGWADLGEYLREYVIHHGRRKVSETPRVEVQGLKTRSSPGYPSPGNTMPPAVSSYNTSGRATPSRPPSVISARPPSSLTVHKKRRGSNASDLVAPRSVTTGTLSSFTSPPAAPLTGRRRLSMSSSYSVDTHSPAHTTGANSREAQSTPLGLAGPKPRSRHVSMSPEGEAWVEDVLQKTRRTSSLNPPPSPLNVAHDSGEVEYHDGLAVPGLPKVRSVSDIRSVGAGTSRRVILRGLGNHR